ALAEQERVAGAVVDVGDAVGAVAVKQAVLSFAVVGPRDPAGHAEVARQRPQSGQIRDVIDQWTDRRRRADHRLYNLGDVGVGSSHAAGLGIHLVSAKV